MAKSKVQAISSRYKRLGKHIVVEVKGAHDSKGNKVYRIVGNIYEK